MGAAIRIQQIVRHHRIEIGPGHVDALTVERQQQRLEILNGFRLTPIMQAFNEWAWPVTRLALHEGRVSIGPTQRAALNIGAHPRLTGQDAGYAQHRNCRLLLQKRVCRGSIMNLFDISPQSIVLRRLSLKSLGQRHELQLAQQAHQRVGLRRLRLKMGRDKFQRAVQLNRRELLAHPGLLALLPQQILSFCRRNFFDSIQQLFDGAELRNQFHRRLFADPFDAGNVVAGVTHEAHDLDHPRRLHAKAHLRICFTKPFIFHGIVNARLGSEQLKHIFVAGDDYNVEAFNFAFSRQGADQIVGLVSGLPNNRQR